MIHRKWHEWLTGFEGFTTTTYGDGSYKEVKHSQCFCGHQWSIATKYNCNGFKVSKTRQDYPEAIKERKE